MRGLSELFIIREMMKRLKTQNKLDNVPRPCEFFDMIAGTNTGGCASDSFSTHIIH